MLLILTLKMLSCAAWGEANLMCPWISQKASSVNAPIQALLKWTLRLFLTDPLILIWMRCLNGSITNVKERWQTADKEWVAHKTSDAHCCRVVHLLPRGWEPLKQNNNNNSSNLNKNKAKTVSRTKKPLLSQLLLLLQRSFLLSNVTFGRSLDYGIQHFVFYLKLYT